MSYAIWTWRDGQIRFPNNSELGNEDIRECPQGPAFNNVSLTDLLWAGANGARSGREWRRVGLEGFIRLVTGGPQDAKKIGPYEKRQWESIWRILAGLDRQPTFADGVSCYEVLKAISDGDFDERIERTIGVAKEVAVHDGHIDPHNAAVEFFQQMG